ncbi:AI-2E family transporter [Pontibacillus yanchengensis]|uniref:AI-2E family transporter n=1 Tax=Pontibacillus yanchengensis TaxID=462910 RepID=A0ACC7VID4_9BACI|nr:AI-2E family transporter [Pontibacillus yanchengensis]MYL54457.1 AI-2E family transporter [Pontibacillus yanchengensis]
MYNKRWFQALVVTILIFILFWLMRHNHYVFEPVFKYVSAIAFPVIAAGVLYYVTRPIVHMLEEYRIPRLLSIFVVFLLLIVVGFLVVNFIAPIAQQQFSRFYDNLPGMINEVENLITLWQSNQDIIPEQFMSEIKSAQEQLTGSIKDVTLGFTDFLINTLAQIVQFLFLLILVPFFLFFMLKDGEKLQPFVSQFFKDKKSESITRLFQRVDHTLSSFIQGQLLVSFFVGILLFIGYVIIDLNYSLTLALFGLITNVIPFAGPYLAVIPAILVALFQDPQKVLWVILIMIIAQQIEGNFISPNVMGKALSIHPLTIITLILAAGSIAGFLGLLFVIPFYAVIKAIIGHFYEEALDSKEF